MRFTRLVLMAAMAGGFVAAPALAQRAGGGELVTVSELVDSLHKSPTASDAVAAYARAVAHAGDSSIVNRAFIVRMIELKHPEMSEAQARSLSREVDDGLPWAVLAYSAAQREELEPAMLNIAKAADRSPNDEFVAQTAGQIVGWYDARQLANSATDPVKTAYASVTNRLSSGRAYTRARNEMIASLAPPQPVYRGGGGVTIVGGGLGVHAPGAGDEYFTSPMALFYDAPYLLFPGYRHGYPPLLPGVTYYYDYWNGGIGAPFPFGTVDRDTRYVRLPGNGYMLANSDGSSSINYSLNQYYDAYYNRPYYNDRRYVNDYRGGYNGGYNGGYIRDYNGGWQTPYLTSPGRPYGQLGESRLSYRMRGGAPLVNDWRYSNAPQTSPYRPGRPQGRR